MMLGCVERRFDTVSAPRPLQWLADNGAAYTAKETIDLAAALNLVPCFTPVRSPESNGVCEASAKTLKRGYVRVNPRQEAISVLQQLPAWFEDYNAVHPLSGLRMPSPREFIARQSATQAACSVQRGALQDWAAASWAPEAIGGSCMAQHHADFARVYGIAPERRVQPGRKNSS